MIFLTILCFSVKGEQQSYDFDTIRIYTSLDEALKNPEKVQRLVLKKKRYKEFPEEIFKFENLLELDLSKNSIEVIPDSISKLSKLRILRMYKNEIHTVSDQIGQLTDLEVLILNRNYITYIPTSIMHLTKLEELDLWGNEIGRLPEEIAYLKDNLLEINIMYNPYPPDNVEELFDWLPNTRIKYTEDCNCNDSAPNHINLPSFNLKTILRDG